MNNVLLNTTKEEAKAILSGDAQAVFRKALPTESRKTRFWLANDGYVYAYLDPEDVHTCNSKVMLKFLKDRSRVMNGKVVWDGFKIAQSVHELMTYYRVEGTAKVLFFKSYEVIREPIKIDLMGHKFMPTTFFKINDPFDMKDLRERLLA